VTGAFVISLSLVTSYDPSTMIHEAPDVPAVGVVVERGRGSLPFALLDGESLVACAAWAMGEAGVRLLDLTTPWAEVREGGVPLVWHDALCPLTPPDFLAECVRRAVAAGAVVAGVLPVTDTVKEVAGDPPVVGRTIDRDGLRRLVSPLVLPVGVVAALPDWPDDDLRVALRELRRSHRVELLTAPPAARRVGSETDLPLLQALTGR
jgi:2-C-methyl-D-erythritol 4-phosphate cytidylyltransferase